MLQRPLWLAVMVFIASAFIFSIHLGRPSKTVFDEHHYVPAAKQIVAVEPNNNYEHPPLAKLLIGFGILSAGDEPFGWRFLPMLFGALLCAALFGVVLKLTRDPKWALVAVAMLWLNGFTFVLSRLAMLEVFTVSFLALAWLMSLHAEEKTNDKRWEFATGACLGLALACKWSALPFWCAAFVWAMYRWRKQGPARALAVTTTAYIALPLTVYALSYIPIMMVGGEPYSPMALLQMQKAMWLTHTQSVPLHSEASGWTDWLFKREPMWLMKDYQIAPESSQSTIQAVMLLGNPAILWVGLAACIDLARFKNSRRLLFVFLIALAPWIMSARSNTFYYYYFPAACVLTVAFACAARAHWTKNWARAVVGFALLAALLFFVFNYPLMSGEVLNLNEALTRFPYSLTPPQ